MLIASLVQEIKLSYASRPFFDPTVKEKVENTEDCGEKYRTPIFINLKIEGVSLSVN
jgi:hypothetical protein